MFVIAAVRNNLTANKADLSQLDDDLKSTTARVQKANNEIAALKDGVEKLTAEAKELQENATDIRSKDVEGILLYSFFYFRLSLYWCMLFSEWLFYLIRISFS